MDTFNANGWSAGFHNGVYNKHMLDLWYKDLVTADSLEAMSPAEKSALENRLQKEATYSSCKDYLVCLFLLLVDKERFKPVTTELSKKYLLGKQDYPDNVLAAKSLMTNFDYSNVGKPTSAGKQQEQVQPTDVALVEKGKWDGGPICYCCGKIHEGEWRECPKASNKEKSKTVDMVDSGNLYPRAVKKWDNTHKNATPKVKKGVVQYAVEEDSKSNNTDEDKVPTY